MRLMKRYPRNIISASKHIQDTGELEEYIKKMENDPFHKIEYYLKIDRYIFINI